MLVWKWLHAWPWALGLLAVVWLAWQAVSAWRRRQRPLLEAQREKQARARAETFVRAHPDWHLRLYRTPKGLRALVMHRTFDPGEPAVAECFQALGADPVYVRMCQRQRCYRARVSPKPWRIGVRKHLKPHPGVWPIRPERMPDRQAWVKAYEEAARKFASCHFVTKLGSSAATDETQAVQLVHDQLCQAGTTLPMG